MTNKILKKKKEGFIDVVVGLQWGDEGKGKNIDELLSHKIYSGVARFQGGANAGHTLKLGDMTFIGHIVPSGCFQKNIELYIGNGVVVDVVSLIKEIKQLKDLDFDVVSRLFISNRAKLVSYLHPFLDQADEYRRNNLGTKVGSTARGIGPVYSDVRARRALLIGDVLRADFEQKEEVLYQFHMNLLNMYKDKYGFKIDLEKIKEAKKMWWDALKEIKKLQICDLSFLIQKRLREGKNILAEGAQGAMLDIDFGDYPNVTSSNTLPSSVCLGLGVSHRYLRDIYGVIKAYTTKVGGGNFPARIKDEALEKLFQKAGNEFGATTGRPRMCGWLDLFALRYAINLSGINKIFINKADICLSDKVKVVTGYKNGRKIFKEFPLYLSEVKNVVTEEIAGWGGADYGVNDKKKVSKELTSYLKYIKSKLADLDIKIISVGTGPDRDHFFNWDK
ncbi:MAG: adenylosuccinate synthetase [Parcubacteria group bacterium GW2011_GWB1_37_13]|nr:MAG: adenylosuccinate synthetase [Parcubacteria group bacterium GW2011_GWB1_37_13]